MCARACCSPTCASLFGQLCTLKLSNMRAVEMTSAMTKYAELAVKVAPTINAMIASYDNADDKRSLQIQALGADLRKLLMESDLSYQDYAGPDTVGVHPCNRNYAMLQPSEVHALLVYIAYKGWSSLETLLALAGEIPHTPTGQEWKVKNHELVLKSDGLLPEINIEKLKIVTVVCSHTNAVLRIVTPNATGKVKCTPATEQFSIDGYVSPDLVFERAPSMREPAERGLKFTIVRWQIIEKCPRLMEVLSEADNAKHDSFRKETPVQAMFNIHRRALAEIGDIDYHKIGKLVSRAHGEAFAKDCEHYSAFVAVYSGGKDALLLHGTEDFTKTLNVVRDVPAEFLGQLAKVKLAEAPLYVHGLYKATLAAPDKFVHNGRAKVFMQNDLAAIEGKLKKSVLKANDMMNTAREFFTLTGVHKKADASKATKILGSFDINLVMFVHSKAGKTKFESLVDIGISFYNQLRAAFPEVGSHPCPWAKVDVASASSAAAGQARESGLKKGMLQEMNVDAKYVEKLGFIKDAEVHVKSEPDVIMRIVAIDDSRAELQEKNSDASQKVKLTRLIDEYVLHIVEAQDHPLHLPLPILSFLYAIARSCFHLDALKLSRCPIGVSMGHS